MSNITSEKGGKPSVGETIFFVGVVVVLGLVAYEVLGQVVLTAEAAEGAATAEAAPEKVSECETVGQAAVDAEGWFGGMFTSNSKVYDRAFNNCMAS
jgi:hypothetical protein